MTNTPASTMVETVARAICAETAALGRPNAEWIDANWRNYEAVARAAIEAMRPDIVRLLRTATVNMPPKLAEDLVNQALNPTEGEAG